MTNPIPQQLRDGLTCCRSLLQTNQAGLQACVAGMVADESVDLTEELERLTAEGDALRRKLAMFENAAAIAVEDLQAEYVAAWNSRKGELGAQVLEAAARRTQLAVQLDHFVEAFNIARRDYDQADEQVRVSLWQAMTIDLSYEQVMNLTVDGGCRSTQVEAIAQVLLEHRYERPLKLAAECSEQHLKSIISSFAGGNEGGAHSSSSSAQRGE